MATLTPRQRASYRNLAHGTPGPILTPVMAKRSNADELEVGDKVEMQGMDGTIKYIGEIKGKPGFYVGAELSRRWADMGRGKNSGDAGGHRYFTCSIPGSGIFIPIDRVSKVASPSNSAEPATPTTPSYDITTLSEQTDRTPPTPGVTPKFSQSVSGRSSSPAFRPKSRPSLPRPESPLRKVPQTQVQATPGHRPSLNMLSQNRLATGPKFQNSPTPAKASTVRMPAKTTNFGGSVRGLQRPPSQISRTGEDDEAAQLRATIQEKNDKIAQLTQEFDNHRADFRSTLDALEVASSETERVYEKRVQDLLEERQMLVSRDEDVDSVARQLRQLEEVVQELEEGLEDARRGEAEARGEVEFLRGEVERVRAELKREREKNATLVNGYREPSTPKTPPRSRSQALAREASPQATQESPLPSRSLASAMAPAHSPATSPTAHTRKPSQAAMSSSAISATKAPSVTKPPAPAASTTAPVADEEKWCALCEQDGHDSISCPYDK